MKKSTIVVSIFVVIISITTFIISEDMLLNVVLTLGGIFLVVGLHLQSKSKPKIEQSDIQKFDIKDEETKECPVCSTKNNINRTYCRHCNTHIKNIVCPVCHHKNSFDQKYCSECDSILQNKTRY